MRGWRNFSDIGITFVRIFFARERERERERKKKRLLTWHYWERTPVNLDRKIYELFHCLKNFSIKPPLHPPFPSASSGIQRCRMIDVESWEKDDERSARSPLGLLHFFVRNSNLSSTQLPRRIQSQDGWWGEGGEEQKARGVGERNIHDRIPCIYTYCIYEKEKERKRMTRSWTVFLDGKSKRGKRAREWFRYTIRRVGLFLAFTIRLTFFTSVWLLTPFSSSS